MKIGEEIEGKYRILDVLGKGGSATVYLAKNKQVGNLWAVKEIARTGDQIKNPVDEAYMLGKLYHPALPKVFDVYTMEDKALIVMEYFKGRSMDNIIRKKQDIDEEDIIHWALQLCSVMMYLHNHKDGTIIYRDLKPSNIIIMPNNNIKLIDFGIARNYKREVSEDTVYIGTKGFAAPEQYGGGQSDKRTDIYGFGITFFCLISGLMPTDKDFSLKNISSEVSGISPHLEKIITKCVSVDPKNRYQRFKEVIEELQAFDNRNVNKTKEYNRSYSTSERKIITVWDNAEYASEMAYYISKHLTGEVLIADFNLLDAQVDIHLGTKMYCNKSKSAISLSGIDILMESLYKGNFTKQTILKSGIKIGPKNNLYVITGNYNVNNYEYFSDECLMKFLDKCLKYFDQVVINVNKCIYDSFTLYSLSASDINIYAGKTDVASLRSVNSKIAFLEKKQKINSDKYKVVSWCESKEGRLPKALLKELTGNKFTGYISVDKKRNKMRNNKKCFAKYAGRDTEKEYIKILKRLGIVKKTIRRKLFNIKMLKERR